MMIASSKALSMVLAIAAACFHGSNGFTPAVTSSRALTTLSMLENSANYSAVSTPSSSDIPNIAPPPMSLPKQEEQDSFFASPTDASSMDIQMEASSEPATAVEGVKKIVKFQTDGDNGIMMECIRPYPTVHKVTPLSLGQKKAGFMKEGIMMAATRSLPKAKKDTSPEPKESSTMLPNNSSFKWKPAAVSSDGKLQWKQREIDCMPMPAE